MHVFINYHLDLPFIQVTLLDAAVKAKPHATWWIKGDGCDIVPGLCESVHLKWSGDVDLNDGKVQCDYQQYKSRLDFVSGLGVGTRQSRSIIHGDLSTLHQQLLMDKEFSVKGNRFTNMVFFIWNYNI